MNKSLEVAYDWTLYKAKYQITKTRERKNIVYKYAYINALKPFLGCSEVGRIIDCNHATVLHAWRVHDTNLKWSQDRNLYEDMYDICVARISEAMGEHCDPLLFRSKGELIDMIRSLQLQLSLYAEEPCFTLEEVS